MRDDPPLDPFADDPSDPAAQFGQAEFGQAEFGAAQFGAAQFGAAGFDDDDALAPLTKDEEAEIAADLADLEVFQVLLEPRGVRGLVVDCQDCEEPHYFAWDLLRANLSHLLAEGQPRVHEPAFSPDPAEYVSWDYARGFADAILAADD